MKSSMWYQTVHLMTEEVTVLSAAARKTVRITLMQIWANSLCESSFRICDFTILLDAFC